MLYCLGNNGTDKVKRNCVVKSYNMAGLNMLDIKKCITSLKATWLRRLLCKRNKYVSYIILDENIIIRKITVLLYLYGTLDFSELQVIVYSIQTFIKVVYYL